METKLKTGEDRYMSRMSGRPDKKRYICEKDDEYPDGPACNVGDGTQDPIATRIEYSGGDRTRKLCHSELKQMDITKLVNEPWLEQLTAAQLGSARPKMGEPLLS